MESMGRVLKLGLALLLATGALAPLGAQATAHETRDEFMARARAQVEANERLQPNRNRARNVILFVGDGMGITTITAARILDGQLRKSPYGGEENALSFEKFPYLAHSKTYQANQQVPDSAPTMTAIVTGSKANDGMLSIAPSVLSDDDFGLASKPASHLETILERAEKRGMWTGVVSTARLTHATPGACYAHTPNRDWESDADLSPGAAAAKFPDIARQFLDFTLRETTINGVRSKGLEVALGGGRENFLTASDTDPEDGSKRGKRKDGRNLAQEWVAAGGRYVWDQAGFDRIDPAKTGPVLGLFERSHMLFEVDRTNEPSLTEMTEKAIRILERGPEGFFLMVEGGRVDHAHHGSNAWRALTETIELARAVERAALMTGEDTLIVVTADHSHAFTMSGYPTRGNAIMGLVVTNGPDGKPRTEPYLAKDGKPYTTLGYANGSSAVSVRPDLTQDEAKAPDYKQQALVPLSSETHGGEDVAIFARGPYAHLFQGTMEQNAIYWVMAKALGFW